MPANYPAAVLGAVAAERLGIDRADGTVQAYVSGHWFTVVGILDSIPLAGAVDRAILIGEGIATELFDYDGHPDTIYARVDPTSVDAVRSVLGRTANPENPEEVEASRPSDALAARDAATENYTSLFLGLGAVALLVGGGGRDRQRDGNLGA